MYIWGPEVNSHDTHLEGQSWWRALVTTKLHSKTLMQDCVAQLLSSSTSERSWLIKIKRGRRRKKKQRRSRQT